MTARVKLLFRAPDLDHSPARLISAASHSAARIGVPERYHSSSQASAAQHNRIANSRKGSKLMDAAAAEAVCASGSLDTGHTSSLAGCGVYSR
jgi:hypothetical protein